MKLIHNNPFRVAGILSNASERELQKQKTKIKAYTKIGKEIDSEYDFHILEEIIRTEDSTNKAFSEIQQNQDKVNHALFWFISASPFDKTALEYLKNGDGQKATEIWGKVTNSKDVNSKNFSAFNNLGTYKLLSNDPVNIKDGIEAKINLIESNFFESFIHSVADKTYTVDKFSQSAKLIDELVEEFKKDFSTSEILEFFSNCNGSTHKYLSEKFTEEPLHTIENLVEKTKGYRKENRGNSYQIGLRLYNTSKEDLSILKSLLGENNLKFRIISDQLANEIMQCGIDYFKHWKDTKDPSKEGLKLLKLAKRIALGSKTIERVKENTEGIEEWAETAPIKEDLAYITSKLKSFQNSSDSFSSAKDLVNSCKNRLINIKNVLGTTDDFYLNISSAVASNALGMVIDIVNEAQSGLEYDRTKLIRLPDIISKAISTIDEIEALDMNRETKLRFSENKTTIKGIHSQVQGIKRTTPSYRDTGNRNRQPTTRTSSSDEGITTFGQILLGVGVVSVILGLAGVEWAWFIAIFIGFGAIKAFFNNL